MLRSTLSLLMVVAMSACSAGNGPAEELRSLFELLANPNVSPSRLGSRVYQGLDDDARAAIDARAAALSERLAVTVAPSDILQIRGVAPGLRVGAVTAKMRDEAHATLDVTFEPVRFTAGGDPAELAAKPATDAVVRSFEVVRQGGRWRVVLAGLAELLAKVPLSAARGGEGG